MSEFRASLIPEGDPNPIDTTVEVRGTLLELRIGTESLGSWPIDELAVERILGGVRMNVDGERAVLKFQNPEPFLDAVGLGKAPAKQKKSRRKRSKSRDETESPSPTDPTPRVEAVPTFQDHPEPPRHESAEPKRKREPKPKKAKEPRPPKVESGVGPVDRLLESLSSRWGGYLPDWLLSKGGIVIVFAVLLALVAKPGWFSVGLLIFAAIGLAISAVAMVDQVVATRIFKGGYTPAKAMVGSLVLGIIGILLGGFF